MVADSPTNWNTAVMAKLAGQMRGCSGELARLGTPSDRLQPVHKLTKQACAPGGTVVRDASGKRLQIALGRDLVVVQVKGRSKATTGLFYMSALRPTTRSFNFLVDVNLGCNPVCKVGTSMDIPVRLLG
jgi:hypothetical protein